MASLFSRRFYNLVLLFGHFCGGERGGERGKRMGEGRVEKRGEGEGDEERGKSSQPTCRVMRYVRSLRDRPTFYGISIQEREGSSDIHGGQCE